MKKLQKFISCLCIMSMLICMTSTTVGAEDTNTTTETKAVSVESVQQMVNELPSIQELNDTNRDTVIAQLDAIDEAKLQLSDEERMQIDFTKYDVAAFVLSNPDQMAIVEMTKTSSVLDGPTPSISFLNETGMAETMLKDILGGSVSACSSVEPVPNGDAVYAYIEAGHYTLHEEVEGEWDLSMTVNGQATDVTDVEFEAGKFYSIMLVNRPPQLNVSGRIQWDDADNQDGKRPEEALVRLIGTADGRVVYENEKKVSVSENWSYSFDDLSKYQNGMKINYSIVAGEVEGYTPSVANNNITYTHAPETTGISGSVAWDDADNQDGKRPEEARVTLTGTVDGRVVYENEKKVSVSENWSYSFDDLSKYQNGMKINYSIVAGEVEGYTPSVANNNIIYTHVPETTGISGSIAWDDANNQDGLRPDSVTVKLFANGKDTEKTGIVDQSNNWSYSFTELPKYEAGNEIQYSVKESTVDGYTSEVSGYNITYNHTPATTNVSGSIAWDDANNQDGLRPESITVKLFADGKDTGKIEVANAANDWKVVFSNLSEKKAGQKVKCFVVVEPVQGYNQPTITGDTETGFTVTYTHIPETTAVSGSVAWDDTNNQDGKRPSEVTVYLSADGNATGEQVTVNAATNWSYSFSELPKYEDGKEICYSIVVGEVEGYIVSMEDDKITYTHMPETTEASGSITWNDADNQEGKRPEQVKVTITGTVDGVVVYSNTIELTEANNWSYSLSNLPKYKNGKEIVYTIKNADVDGYTLKMDENHNFIYSQTEEKIEKPEDKLPTSEKINKTENETVVSENTNKTVNKQTGASTGDTTDVRSVGVLMGISLIVLLSIFLKKKSMK